MQLTLEYYHGHNFKTIPGLKIVGITMVKRQLLVMTCTKESLSGFVSIVLQIICIFSAACRG